MNCLLCESTKIHDYFKDLNRNYYQCRICSLVFAEKSSFLNSDEEKKRYDLHQNSPNDPQYRNFLNQLFSPLNERLNPESRGLDFGSGPGPTLSVMFEEAGHAMEIYDCFYAKRSEVLKQKYDFVTASEVVEHLHKPCVDLNQLWKCIEPKGYFGIMTQLVINPEAFAKWHYKDDPTHVGFYSENTFKWLAKKWNADLNFISKSVILIQKK